MPWKFGGHSMTPSGPNGPGNDPKKGHFCLTSTRSQALAHPSVNPKSPKYFKWLLLGSNNAVLKYDSYCINPRPVINSQSGPEKSAKSPKITLKSAFFAKTKNSNNFSRKHAKRAKLTEHLLLIDGNTHNKFDRNTFIPSGVIGITRPRPKSKNSKYPSWRTANVRKSTGGKHFIFRMMNDIISMYITWKFQWF